MTNSMDIITVKNLTKTYQTYQRGNSFKETVKSFFKRVKMDINAVNDISFTVKEGEICGLLGPNGAGKSTTIKMLCGALYPTKGDLRVLGMKPAPERRRYVRHIGAVFGQKSQLIWDIPPIDSFHMNKAIYGINDIDFDARLTELSEALDVKEIMLRPTRVLSLGERMKCEFIMAMLHGPKIVFLDEPTIGLDVIAKNKIRDFIKKINEKGTTIILTTHDLEDVNQLAERVIVINHGQKVFDDTLHRLQTNLGEKKIIGLTLTETVNEIDVWLQELFGRKVKYIKLISQSSPLEISLELDTEKIPIDGFLKQISAKVKFSDIAVKELPMDEIIMKIYEEA